MYNDRSTFFWMRLKRPFPHEDSDQLLQRSRELIEHIADRCGREEVRDGFLSHPAVRKALGIE